MAKTLLNAALDAATETLREAGVVEPETDADLLCAHVLDVSRGRLQALRIMGAELSAPDANRLRQLVNERAHRVPLQHLTGVAPFRNVQLRVGPGVFIPRPETEITAQHAIDALQAVPCADPIAVDLCTGSGAIALCLATEVPTSQVWAVEKSPEAHAWAERNIARLGEDRVSLICGDLADLLSENQNENSLTQSFAPLRGAVHVLVSNPPYVPDGMVPRDPEVRDHDPHLALFGGVDGLDVVRDISRVGQQLLVPGGTLVLEHAESQGDQIRALLLADGWRAPATHQDLTYRDRVTTALR